MPREKTAVNHRRTLVVLDHVLFVRRTVPCVVAGVTDYVRLRKAGCGSYGALDLLAEGNGWLTGNRHEDVIGDPECLKWQSVRLIQPQQIDDQLLNDAERVRFRKLRIG